MNNTLEKNYLHSPNENLLKESESDFEWSPTGGDITEATKGFMTILLPMEHLLSDVKFCVCVPLRGNVLILRPRFNLSMAALNLIDDIQKAFQRK